MPIAVGNPEQREPASSMSCGSSASMSLQSKRAAQRVRARMRPAYAPSGPSRHWNCGGYSVFVERTSDAPPSSPDGTIACGIADDVHLASHLFAGRGPGKHGLRSLSSTASVELAAEPPVGGFHAHAGFCLFVDASLPGRASTWHGGTQLAKCRRPHCTFRRRNDTSRRQGGCDRVTPFSGTR